MEKYSLIFDTLQSIHCIRYSGRLKGVLTVRTLARVCARPRAAEIRGDCWRLYRHLYRHCSQPLEPMAAVDRDAWARATETVHFYGDTRGGARVQARVVWTLHSYSVSRQLSCFILCDLRYTAHPRRFLGNVLENPRER
jgi:hypothetical protein